ncbi:hypothetical protein C5F64_16310 [Photobacterium damselae subsp. damselae]|nr:hypothetical protein C5F64_16310 [Photobacterium damselae subsp. damselae]
MRKVVNSLVTSAKRRLISGGIDFAIVTVVTIPVTYLLFCILKAELLNFGVYIDLLGNSLLIYLAEAAALLGINWPYLRSGQTIGMRLVGTKVVMANGEPVTFVTAVLRLIVYIMSEWIVWGIRIVNLALMIFHPQKRTVHDLLSGTIVVDC